jgi:hypothetical protein
MEIHLGERGNTEVIENYKQEVIWGRELTVGCPVVVSPLPREWSYLYRRGQPDFSFLIVQKYF